MAFSATTYKQNSRATRGTKLEQIGFIERACFVSVFCLAAIASPAQTFTTLHSFNGTDGSAANSGLVRGTDGNFYGTTVEGGANQTCGNNSSCGTVFQITPGGTLTTLHSFNGTDGAYPEAGLVQGSDGKFYGTTLGGNGADGYGTIFSIIPGGTPVTLYNFCSQTNCADGSNPDAPLVQGSDGNFYGTTFGNPNNNFTCSGNCGTVFKMTPSGTLTTLYTFDGTGGYAPAARLVQGSEGDFYGTTSLGGAGAAACPTAINTETCGTVFKITPQGTLTTLYNFCTQSNCSDGNGPSMLVQGTDGNFYGTTAYGGGIVCVTPSNHIDSCGTVFKITPGGTLTTLHIFDGTDGVWPFNGMIQGTDGNFYGTTNSGGVNGLGTLFRITPGGTLITLYNGETEGVGSSGLLQVTDGNFYGATGAGGANNLGTVYSFAIGLGGTASSSTSLSLSPAGIAVGSAGPVVMTATVTPTSGNGVPTGVVAFFHGSSELGSSNLSGGAASFDYNPSSLALNTYPITALYSGDGTFATSTSSAQTLTINSLPLAATPTFSPGSGSYGSAQTVTINDTTTGATIYYTNDGTTPTTSSAVYNGPLTVSSTESSRRLLGPAVITIAPWRARLTPSA